MKFYSRNKQTLAYWLEDLTQWYGKDDFDRDNREYANTWRFMMNSEIGIMNRRQYSINMAENGVNANLIGKNTGIEYIVTFKPYGSKSGPYSIRVHGNDIYRSGILNAVQLNHVLENLGSTDNGMEFPNRFEFITNDGKEIEVRAVQLRQGKRNERIVLTEDDRLEVLMTYRNFQRLKQKGRKKVVMG